MELEVEFLRTMDICVFFGMAHEGLLFYYLETHYSFQLSKRLQLRLACHSTLYTPCQGGNLASNTLITNSFHTLHNLFKLTSQWH